MAGRRPLRQGRVHRLSASGPDGLSDAELEPATAHWDDQLGEFVLDWNDIRDQDDPHGLALAFVRSVARYACAACEWDPALARSVLGDPPPIR